MENPIYFFAMAIRNDLDMCFWESFLVAQQFA